MRMLSTLSILIIFSLYTTPKALKVIKVLKITMVAKVIILAIYQGRRSSAWLHALLGCPKQRSGT